MVTNGPERPANTNRLMELVLLGHKILTAEDSTQGVIL
jgi:hypothetical protein